MSEAKIYIVATPIGNLGDITHRAVEVLKSVDVILCEDTRVTKKLLSYLEISTPTRSYHQHSSDEDVKQILSLLVDGKNIALVTDAGTPGISDPGNMLLQDVYNSDADIEVIAVPGASAVVAALSISGFPTDKFLFQGFPPHKNKRKKYFEEVASSKYTVAFYESNHRIKKALRDLVEVLDGDREVCICRELTKKFESVYRGTISEVSKMDIKEKGEFVVIVRA
jgi:16S rRNA (cytidine1402-2'-O)-methyltransferase